MDLQLEDAWFRPAAHYLVKTKGLKQKEVANLFGVSEQRVSGVMKRFRETGSHQDRARTGRPLTARTPVNVQKKNE